MRQHSLIAAAFLATISSTAFGAIWTETFDNGVGRFNETVGSGSSLFTWDSTNQRMRCEFRRDNMMHRRLANINTVLGPNSVFGFSAVVTPLDRNTTSGTPNCNIESVIGFVSSTNNNYVGIKVRDSGYGVGNFGVVGLPAVPGDGPIGWQRYHTYFIDFLLNGPANLITWSIYEGTNSSGTLLGTQQWTVPSGVTMAYDRIGMSSDGGNSTPSSLDGYLRVGVDNFSYTVPEPVTAILFAVTALIGIRRRHASSESQ